MGFALQRALVRAHKKVYFGVCDQPPEKLISGLAREQNHDCANHDGVQRLRMEDQGP